MTTDNQQAAENARGSALYCLAMTENNVRATQPGRALYWLKEARIEIARMAKYMEIDERKSE